MKIKKRIALLNASLFLFQGLLFPVTTSVSFVAAKADTIDWNELDHPAESYLTTPEIEVAPIFSFQNEHNSNEAGEVVSLTVLVNQQVSEVTLNLPPEVLIETNALPSEMAVSQVSGNQWTVSTNQLQEVFTIPVIAQKAGMYTVEVGDSLATLEIIESQIEEVDQVEEVVENDLEDQASENLENNPTEIATESTDLELTDTREVEDIPSVVTEDTSPEAEIGVQDVANWEELIRAFSDTAIHTINIISDFETTNNPRQNVTGLTTGATTNPTSGTAYVYLNTANISRTLTIEGNNHQIDFRAVALCFNNVTARQSNPWNITIKDLEIYHGNYYGPITYNDLSTTNEPLSTITYHNITNIGNQLIHSPRAMVRLSGKTSSNQVATYTSKFRTQTINATNQTNIEVSKITILENAEIDLSTINAGNIDLGNTLRGDFVMEAGSSLTAVANGTAGEADGVNLLIRSGSVLIDENAKVSLTPRANFSSISLRSTGSLLNIGGNSELSIHSTSRSNSTNANNRNFIWMAAGSSLIVEDGGKLSVKATGQGNTSSNILHVNGAANVMIGKDATLDIQSDSTAAGQNLMYFANANSSFTFADAKRVNLQRTSTISSTSNGLINIAGSSGRLGIDVQEVKQWNRGNFEEEPDHSWIPIFNLDLRYSSISPTIANVSSISQAVVDDFRENFTTQNVQRVLFEKMPDVDITINALSGDWELPTSRVITGRATPNSVIRFSGDSAIPAGVIDSPDISETEKYHTVADEDGNYRFELSQAGFTAGNEVVAFAFLNGKTAQASTIVQEKEPQPNPVDPIEPEIEVIPEDGPEIPTNQGRLSIDFASQFRFGTQKIAISDKTYFAEPQRLVGEDGDRPNYVQVSDRRVESERDGWQLAVTQTNQFTNQNNHELKGARINFLNQQLATVNQEASPQLREESKITLIPENRSILLTAREDEGLGTWIYRFGDEQSASQSVTLEVPKGANPEATSYVTTLSWELSSVPEN
jgi:hypothetical protein